jgi:hypothetical protein
LAALAAMSLSIGCVVVMEALLMSQSNCKSALPALVLLLC